MLIGYMRISKADGSLSKASHCVQLVGQILMLLRQRPSRPGDIQLPERRSLLVGRDKFGASGV